MSLGLHNAAREGNVVELTKLLAQSSSVQTRDKHSRTPLHLAAWAGQLECCKLLVAEGADKGAAAMDDTTALHFAAQKGHPEVVRFLLNEGSPEVSLIDPYLADHHMSVPQLLCRCEREWEDKEGHDGADVCCPVR